jgi:hypothetical protein
METNQVKKNYVAPELVELGSMSTYIELNTAALNVTDPPGGCDPNTPGSTCYWAASV